MRVVFTDDIECVSAAVEVCSDTLECVSIECGNHGTRQFLLWTSNQLTSTSALVIPQTGAVGLSQARRLKEVVFRLGVLNDVWITLALKTITPDHRDLRQISIYIPTYSFLNTRQSLEEIYSHWADLDCFLVKLRDLNTIHTRVIHGAEGEEDAHECIEMLPEMMKRRIIELVDQRMFDQSYV